MSMSIPVNAADNIFNHAHAQEGYSLSVCLSVSAFTARIFNIIDLWYPSLVLQNLNDSEKVLDLWILLKSLWSKVIASFTFRSRNGRISFAHPSKF